MGKRAIYTRKSYKYLTLYQMSLSVKSIGILHFLSVHPLLRTLEIQGIPFIFNPGIPVGGSQNNPGIPVGGGQNNPGIPVGGGQNKKNLHGNSGGRG